MKTIYNEADKNEILARIEKLTPESKALWGKMNVSQMLAHSALGAELSSPASKVKILPISFIGQFFKKSIIHSDMQFRKNSPTSPELKIVDAREFSKEKAAFIATVNKLYTDGGKGVKAPKHPFFGKMTPEEWGILNYKHADHHLRQFGV
jgi:hypothetical protein